MVEVLEANHLRVFDNRWSADWFYGNGKLSRRPLSEIEAGAG